MFAERIDFSHEANLTIDELVKRAEVLLPEADLTILRKCFEFADKMHSGVKRSSGEPYIIHPLNVAATLIKLKMDLDSIMAGLLHDTVEDCDVSPEDIAKMFGQSVAQIVVGCTKISKIKFKTKEESQAENFRKMVVAMAQDLRVIIVKLADRMHNMRTLQYMTKEKQQAKAQETLDIYVPLASRLGINSVKADLEDLCLRYIHPDIYYRLAEKIAMKKREREAYITETHNLIEEKMLEYSVTGEVTGRPKHFFSIYKKMQQRGVDFEQIQDLLAFRILVNNITECYKCLGIIHSAFTPVPGRFKDYIAIPKVNNYQSLHTTVIGPKAERIEIQIRTFEMHEVAERGVAAHWKYKERNKGEGVNKLKWVEELMEFNQNVQNSSEFMDVVKNDLDVGGVFIFTPTGDVKELRYGATPLDFAYAVHTEVGNKTVGAKVNGKMVPLKYRLKSGDTVEILTSKTQTPSKDWLKICKTSRAITKIRQYLMKVERDEHRTLGEDVLEKALKKFETSIKALDKKGEFKPILEKNHYKTLEELFVNIGSNHLPIKDVLVAIPSIAFTETDELDFKEDDKELESYYKKVAKTARKSTSNDNAVIVDGLDDIMVKMGRCCNPIPGDPITGIITRGRGITVHTIGCGRIVDIEKSRQIHVEWNKHYTFSHPVNIKVTTHDKPGILSKISKSINNAGINIRSAIARSMPDQKGNFIFEIEVKDYSELLKTISSIEQMEEVISVNRA
ncbi:RelA/SpoT family protein [Peredibacter starrii]|uniref:Bifunctional (P)ppGpp synthetase/guanosine-3',5'-bis(Diphosphate) 3'-pyrophosphohydrolase n=1 Tax=Peredibacter starrii TaxID=28202 RepID=A0AAX4HNR1_9BACT|nr:bifunctional (p)ppGpp synthetase/guanosine-3',5'-bis(diphosphate) 3'-pyrophosphohydrolase [Peredibacter starrii]WPU64773.1 bifunctional (p)ppGpp synthetase/guanosine-3',5'-bis(diphosphate) 3'-pyrophosphohydrolase [Peredibacter starrii]